MENSNALSIFKSYKGKNIRINSNTRYVCLTDMASASGKRLNNWTQTEKANSYLEALSVGTGIPVPTLLYVSDGNPAWGHPKVALRFAQWCNDEFAIQVDSWIDELLTTGSVSITQPELPPSAIEYIQASKTLQELSNPMLKSLLEQRLMEELTPTNKLISGASESTKIILTVRAQELGYKSSQIGSGSSLGKFVLKQGISPIGKVQHGKYPVNVYDLTTELDRSIHNYFS